MVIVDAVIRLVPGVLGDAESSRSDSFSTAGRLLEFAQYTRPREYRGLEVPEILLSGDHGEIARWREENSRRRTEQWRSSITLPWQGGVDAQRRPTEIEKSNELVGSALTRLTTPERQ